MADEQRRRLTRSGSSGPEDPGEEQPSSMGSNGRDDGRGGDLVEDEVEDGKHERPPRDEAGEPGSVTVRRGRVRSVVVPVDEPGRESDLNGGEEDDEAENDWREREGGREGGQARRSSSALWDSKTSPTPPTKTALLPPCKISYPSSLLSLFKARKGKTHSVDLDGARRNKGHHRREWEQRVRSDGDGEEQNRDGRTSVNVGVERHCCGSS